jgi:hypothetical protein
VSRLAGQPEKAREACTQSLRLNPNYEEARQLQTKLENETKAADVRKPAPK